jgi:hypothetical protein
MAPNTTLTAMAVLATAEPTRQPIFCLPFREQGRHLQIRIQSLQILGIMLIQVRRKRSGTTQVSCLVLSDTRRTNKNSFVTNMLGLGDTHSECSLKSQQSTHSMSSKTTHGSSSSSNSRRRVSTTVPKAKLNVSEKNAHVTNNGMKKSSSTPARVNNCLFLFLIK